MRRNILFDVPPSGGGSSPVQPAGSIVIAPPFFDCLNLNPNGAIAFSGVANQVRFFLFFLPFTFTVRKITIRVSSGIAASFATCALYNAAGTNIVLDAGANAFDTSAGNTTRSVTVATTTLSPAQYYLGWGSTAVAPTAGGVWTVGASANINSIINQNAVRIGRSPNTLSGGGAMPASLGSPLTSDTTFDVPNFWFEA